MDELADTHIMEMLKNPATRDKGFLQLMDAFKKPVYWHIRRMVVSHEDAEDILQETFIKVYRFADSFKGESRLFTWIYRIATNECSQHFRKNKNWLTKAETITEKMASDFSHNDTEDGEVLLVKFQQAILTLPEKQRIVFNLRYYDELSYEEISQITGASVNTLKTNYHYATGKVRQFLIDRA